MGKEYSVEVCEQLSERFRAAGLHRPQRIARYDAGAELAYEVTDVAGGNKAQVRLVVEEFVGGGFAGQVYRVKVTQIQTSKGGMDGLQAGGVYVMKILIPPGGFARLFRSALYRVGFQGPFQLQVNPAAARAGALWQKFIRRAAKIRFGDQCAVVDVHATFVDSRLGSCGELSEWVEGRTWRLEVDDRLDLLKRWRRGGDVDADKLGSPEYRAKRKFMRGLVELFCDMGAYELARQYEWSTCKSQPNCLKRQGAENDPSTGLVAVDFRPGLALLPFLPMSPGDFKLIAKGLVRGSIVQFDRGDVGKLERFVKTHSDEFADMRSMLDELKRNELVYRDSVPDVTHNHIRLLYSARLWSAILDSSVTGWRVRNTVDDVWQEKLRRSRPLAVPFLVIGAIPFLGGLVQRIWGRADWRKHYLAMLASWGYLRRAVAGRIAEKTIAWHRAGRVDSVRSLKVAGSIGLFSCHLPLSVLPAGLHRFLTDARFRREKLIYIFVRPFKLYFNPALREQWLRDMVTEGRTKQILTDQDAETILSQLGERYIQRYLISLVVHLLTLPLTQIVSVIVAWVYYRKTGDTLGTGGILVLFQITPISPGSIARGLYAVGIAIYDRSFKDYNIAVFLSFIKYIGYLAFPIQMTCHYPALARFMAAHWATEAVHIVPVFGERGALLEHWVFCAFYNWPLTIRRRMRQIAQVRSSIKLRYWHTDWYILGATVLLGIVDFVYLRNVAVLPNLRQIWWLWVIVSLVCGAGVTTGCGGARLSRRIIAAAVCGVGAAVLYTLASAILAHSGGIAVGTSEMLINCLWRMFIFTIFSAIGAVLTELTLPEPKL